MSATLYSLLVGINDYPEPVSPLKGCVNDVMRFKDYLEKRIEGEKYQLRTLILVDQQASREAVIESIRGHLMQAGEQDVALFYYSGHGSQEDAPREFWHLEPDKMNETLVLWDSRMTGGSDLADKELSYLISEVANRGAHVVVILDACHSGSGTRDARTETAVRWVPADRRKRDRSSYLLPGDFLLKADLMASRSPRNSSGWFSLPEGRHVLLAACLDRELAREYVAGGQSVGAFSHFLLEALIAASGLATYRDVFNQAKAGVMYAIADQTPQIEVSEGGDLEQSFLGGAVRPQPGYFTIRFDRSHDWVMEGGAIHGVQRPRGGETTRLALFPFNANLTGVKIEGAATKAQVDQVRIQESTIIPEEPSKLDPQLTYKGLVIGLPLPPMKIGFFGDEIGLEMAREALAKSNPKGGPSLFVSEGKYNFRYRLLARNGEYRIYDLTEDRLVTEPIPGYSAANAELAIHRLEHIARWKHTAELKNVAGLLFQDAIRVNVILEDEEISDSSILAEYRYQKGKWVQPNYRLRIENHTHSPLYCAVLGLWESFAIQANFFPAGVVRIEPARSGKPGEVYSKLMYASVPKEIWSSGVTERRDLLKVIVSSTMFDPRLLEQGRLPYYGERSVGIQPESAPKGALNWLMHRIQTREAVEEPEVESLDDWVTKEIVMTIRRPQLLTPVPRERHAVPLGAGVNIEPHPSLLAQARLTSTPCVLRDTDNRPLPAVLEAASRSLYFNPSRGGDPGLNVLELSHVHDHSVVTPQDPLVLNIELPIQENEHILPVAYDGEFYLPLGYAQLATGGNELILERLPEPQPLEERDMKGAIRIFFQKIVSTPLGLGYPYPILAAAIADPPDNFEFEADTDKVAQYVRDADRITLLIHGFLGDTRSILTGARKYSQSDLILTYDYESFNTSVKDNARSLKDRLERVGLGQGHSKRLRIVAHSLGGIVARWFIEKEGGNELVERLVVLGSPNAGTPWTSLHEWATFGIGLAINGLTVMSWPVKILGFLASAIEKVDVTLDEINPGSQLLTELDRSADPHISYMLIAGNTSIIPGDLVGAGGSRVSRLWKRLGYSLASLQFVFQPNDIAISVSSALHIEEKRSPKAQKLIISCDHVSFFELDTGLEALRQRLR